MVKQCKLVIVSNFSGFNGYLRKLSQSVSINHIDKSKHIIYPEDSCPIYVKSVNQLDTMDGFGIEITGMELFMSESQKLIDFEELAGWFQMVEHNNLKYKVEG